MRTCSRTTNQVEVAALAFLTGMMLTGCSGQLISSTPVHLEDSSIPVGHLYSLPQQLVEVVLTPHGIQLSKREQAIVRVVAARDVAKKQFGEKKALATQQQGTLDALKGDSSGAINAVTKALAKTKLELAVAGATLAYWEKELSKLQEIPHQKGDKVTEPMLKVRLLPLSPDPNFQFVANLNHKAVRSDKLSITTTSSGLLSGAIGHSDDQTAGVLSTVVSTIAAQSAGVALEPIEAIGDESCRAVSREMRWIVDPTELQEVNANLSPYCLRITSSPISVSRSDNNVTNSIDAVTNLAKKHRNASSEVAYGLFYRRSEPWMISLASSRGAAPGTFQTVSRQVVFLPNKSPVALLPFETGALTRTDFDVAFQNGMLTKLDTTRPSEALAAASLPLSVVRAVFSTVSEVIQLRIDYSSKAKAEAEAERDLIKALLELETTRSEATDPPDDTP